MAEVEKIFPGAPSMTRRIGQRLLASLLLRRALVMLWYAAGAALCFYVAFLLRFESEIGRWHWGMLKRFLPVLVVVRLATFVALGLHRGTWRFVAFRDAVVSGLAVVISTAVFTTALYIMQGGTFAPFPRSVIVIDALLYALYCVGGRFCLRLVRETGMLERGRTASGLDESALVVGALPQVNALLAGLRDDPAAKRRIQGVVCKDDEFRGGGQLQDVPIVGGHADAARLATETGVRVLLVVEPFTTPNALKELTDACARAGARVELRMIPSVSELVGERMSVSHIRKVGIEDLLGRAPVRFERKEVAAAVQGASVLVTGAGGSIGSELVRQLVRYSPRAIVLYENNEYALYSITKELEAAEIDCTIVPVAGDIRFAEEFRHALRRHDCRIVFHTAAYKHVPLMEQNVVAAMRTNVLGSHTVVSIAQECGVERLVLVSSDKAVRPTSMMGATKRLAERVVLEAPTGVTDVVVVRFGNVIGSSGSVVPVFQEQIAEGGPVTVTTPNATRYFMTIPEAVDLMLQASLIGDDRDIMVLEMGEPMKIEELARRLIELSGFVPEVDIKISYIGLRPGEKEYEELLTADEGVVRTPYDKIWVVSNNSNGEPELPLAEIRGLVDLDNSEALRAIAHREISDNLFDGPAGNDAAHIADAAPE
jgi:FlaA1/EpsC-like NDP-sugar epimerase